MSSIHRPISELCDRQIEQRDPREQPNVSIRYIDIGSVNNRTKRIEAWKEIKGREASVRARQIVKAGDVLVSTVRPNLNTVALVDAELDGAICSTGFCVLRSGPELNSGYLFAFVQSQQFVDSLVELVQGALYPAVTDRQVLSQSIPWVELKLQRQLSSGFQDQFSSLAIAKSAVRKQLSELDLLPQKLLGQVFSERWPTVRLGELLHGIETGRSLQTTEQIARDDELGVIKVSAMTWGDFRPREAKSIEGDYQPDEHHRIRKGDVLISRANTVELVGAVVRVDRDYPNRLLSDKSLRLVLDESKCDPDYVVQALRWPEARAHIEGNATGTSNSMRNISQDTIRETPLRLPERQEQSRIASTLKRFHVELGRARTASKAQLVELDLLPQKLLAQVFGN